MKFMVTSLKNEMGSKELTRLAQNLNNLMREKDIKTKQLSVLKGSVFLISSDNKYTGGNLVLVRINIENRYAIKIAINL